MERGASPTPSTSGHSSQDYAQHRRSVANYRLFPIVEPTPPPSPLSFKGVAPNRPQGAHRRRSSSVANTSKETIASASGQPVTLPATTFRTSRQSSLHNLRTPHDDEDARANVSASLLPAPRSERDHGTTPGVPHNYAHRVASPTPPQVYTNPERGSSTSRLSRSVQGVLQPRSRRSKPNLRIAVEGHRQEEGALPSPHQPSPHHYREDSEETVMSQAGGPRTPDHRDPAASYQPLTLPLNADLKTRESTATPPSARGRSVRKFFPRMHPMTPTGTTRPTSPSGNSSAPDPRPNTSAGVLTSWSQRTSSLPQKRPLESVKGTRPTISRPLEASKSHTDATPAALAGRLRGYQSTDMLRGDEPILSQTQPNASSRPATAASMGDDTTSGADVLKSAQPNSGGEVSGSLIKPSVNAALALARANVAALKNSESSITSPASEAHHSASSEMGALNRAMTAEALTRRESSPGAHDPVETLKVLSTQSEMLHARYASLRADRQRISSRLVEKLKEQQPGGEAADGLLDDQLSLAAVNSSMDICFAKLKSLECRKEDAVAELVAQVTQSRTSHLEHHTTAHSTTTCYRKPSLAHSVASSSHYAYTGRSSPDIGDGASTNRSTRSSLPRTTSYGSETNSQDHRLSTISHSSSFRLDLTKQLELGDKLAHETIHEMSESPQQPAFHPEVIASSAVHESHAIDHVGMVETIRAESVASLERQASSSGSVYSTMEASPESSRSIRVSETDAVKTARVGSKSSTTGRELLHLQIPPESGMSSIKQSQHASEVNIEFHPTRASVAPTAFPPRASSMLHSVTVDKPESPALHDLEAQLQRFPRPVPAPLRLGGKLPITMSPLAAHPPTPSDPSPPVRIPSPPAPRVRSKTPRGQEREGEVAAERRHDSVMRNPNLQPSRAVSVRTTHTIQVYMDQDEAFDLHHDSEPVPRLPTNFKELPHVPQLPQLSFATGV